MHKAYKLILIIIITTAVVVGCKKDEEPVPVDNFVGEYTVQEILEEYDPSDPELQDEAFLAPQSFTIAKSDFLDPITGEMVTSYKFFIADLFFGLAEQSGSQGMVLVGTQGCQELEDLNGVSVTIQSEGLYRLNMINCRGREVIADYSKVLPD